MENFNYTVIACKWGYTQEWKRKTRRETSYSYSRSFITRPYRFYYDCCFSPQSYTNKKRNKFI